MAMSGANIKKITRVVVVFITVAVLFVFVINYYEIESGRDFLYMNMENMSPAETAIVFGAKVRNEQMSPMFEDRVVSAMNLYKAKRVKKILVSGDHGRREYDEVNVAKDYLVSNGVNADDIFTDYAGFDTYDTIYRAKEVFDVGSAILVTQKFHLYRAIYIAKNLDMNVNGYSADIHIYSGSEIYSIRELFARVKAYFDVVVKSKPKYLGAKIPITGDGRKSWD